MTETEKHWNKEVLTTSSPALLSSLYSFDSQYFICLSKVSVLVFKAQEPFVLTIFSTASYSDILNNNLHNHTHWYVILQMDKKNWV